MFSASTILAELHDHYVEAVNMAVADNDEELVAELTSEYDRELALAMSRIEAVSAA